MAPRDIKVHLILIASALSPILWTSQSARGATPEELYHQGKTAYERQPEPDYLTALKCLFAYRELVREDLSDDGRELLNGMISYLEGEVGAALRTRDELRKNGHVVGIVVETEGK